MVRSRAKKALVAAGRHDDAEVYVDETNHLRGDLDALIAATTNWVNVLPQPAPPAIPAEVVQSQRTESPTRPAAREEVGDEQSRWSSSLAHREEVVQSLRQLKSLADEGILTVEEYETKRQPLVDLL